MAVELLRFVPQVERVEPLWDGLIRAAPAAGMRVTQTKTYQGHEPWLMFWGPGGPDRFEPMRRHCEQGGHVVAWDLAYWDRFRKCRVSIDAAHPQAWVLRRDWPGDRLHRDQVAVSNTWRQTGPIIVAGIGRKARVQYDRQGVNVLAWEMAQIEACRAQWPGRTIQYRPKTTDQPTPPGVGLVGGTIEQALTGASLLITWHSNVAVDAIRLGIPVVCKDGAAAAVSPSSLPAAPTPLPQEARARFLNNLAYFQWAPSEGLPCWQFLRTVLA